MIRLIGYFFGIGRGRSTCWSRRCGGLSSAMSPRTCRTTRCWPNTSRRSRRASTRRRLADGRVAHERRLYLPIQAMPDRVKAAFLSAEDKNFYNHPGVDITGLFRAVAPTSRTWARGQRPVGASTITQQVAKNFLLDSSETIDRKIKETILSLPHRAGLFQGPILELYLNEIFFGLGAYGVAGAALTYFDKSVNELTSPRPPISRRCPRALQLPPVQAHRPRDRAPQLGDRPDGRERLCHRGGG